MRLTTKGLSPELSGRVESLPDGGSRITGVVQLSTGTLATLTVLSVGLIPSVLPFRDLGLLRLSGWVAALPAGFVLGALTFMLYEFLPHTREALHRLAEIAESPVRAID